MNQGDIYLVKFLNSVGHEYQKDRPAIIIQDNFNNIDIITIIPFTSKTNNRTKNDILVIKNSENRLYCDSLLKVSHIQSFDRSRFIKKIGKIDEEILKEIKRYLKVHFNIS